MPAPVTIEMNDDGTYRIKPPFAIINRGDQKITWKLKGRNWSWMSTPQGIICDTSQSNPPYTAWPGAPAKLNSGGDYEADAASPNTGTDWIFYKWTLTVWNTATNQVVQADPDIGNDPRP